MGTIGEISTKVDDNLAEIRKIERKIAVLYNEIAELKKKTTVVGDEEDIHRERREKILGHFLHGAVEDEDGVSESGIAELGWVTDSDDEVEQIKERKKKKKKKKKKKRKEEKSSELDTEGYGASFDLDTSKGNGVEDIGGDAYGNPFSTSSEKEGGETDQPQNAYSNPFASDPPSTPTHRSDSQIFEGTDSEWTQHLSTEEEREENGEGEEIQTGYAPIFDSSSDLTGYAAVVDSPSSPLPDQTGYAPVFDNPPSSPLPDPVRSSPLLQEKGDDTESGYSTLKESTLDSIGDAYGNPFEGDHIELVAGDNDFSEEEELIPQDDWTKRFQTATLRLQSLERRKETMDPKRYISESLASNLEFINLSQDFIHTAKTYGKVIISELYIENKTIPPLSVDGQVVEDQYIINNMLFKFALDTNGLFKGNHRSAAKVAGHELKGAMTYYSLNVPRLTVPLIALVDYRGYRLIAVSLQPLSGTSLQYGTSDGGFTVHKGNKELNTLMRLSGESLKIPPHICGFRPNHTKILWAAADMEGHVGKDGSFYMLGFSRALPPTTPDKRIFNGHLFQLFRRDFISHYEKPLCPDGFSSFIIHDPKMKEYHQDLRDATSHLLTNVIGKFAKEWLFTTLEASEYNTLLQLNVHKNIHHSGINMRYCGAVVSKLVPLLPQSTNAIQLLMIESASRIIKNHLHARLQEKMSELKLPLEVPYRRVVIDYMNLVFSNTKESSEYWNTQVKEDMKVFFNFTWFGKNDENPTFSLQSQILWYKFKDGTAGRSAVFQRVISLTGLRFSTQTIQKFHGKTRYNPQNPFDLLDLIEIGERVKHMNIVSKCQAKLLLTKARGEENEFGDQLFLSSLEKLEDSLSSNSDDSESQILSCIISYNYLSSLYTQNKQPIPFPNKDIEVIKLDQRFMATLHRTKNNVLCLVCYAKFLEMSQRYDRAEDSYLKALLMDPHHLYGLLQYGNFLLKRYRLHDAHVIFGRVTYSKREIIDPFTGRPLELRVRVYLDNGTFKTTKLTPTTTVTDIRNRLISHLICTSGKEDTYAHHKLILHGEEIVTLRSPLNDSANTESKLISQLTGSFHTRLLADDECPYVIFQRPKLGDKCKLLFRTTSFGDFPPIEIPFNAHPKYFGPKFVALTQGRQLRRSGVGIGLGATPPPLIPVLTEKVSVPVTLTYILLMIQQLSEGVSQKWKPTVPKFLVKPKAAETATTSANLFFLRGDTPSLRVRSDPTRKFKKKLPKTAGPVLLGMFRGVLVDQDQLWPWLICLTGMHFELVMGLYSIVASCCTNRTCGEMCISEKLSLKWHEKLKENPHPEHQKTAKGYIQTVKNWAEAQLHDPILFPPYGSSVFAQKKSQIQKKSIAKIREMNRMLFSVFCHIYYRHWLHLMRINALPLAKTIFRIIHGILIEVEFEKKELEEIFSPVFELVEEIKTNWPSILGELDVSEAIEKDITEKTSSLDPWWSSPTRKCIVCGQEQKEGEENEEEEEKINLQECQHCSETFCSKCWKEKREGEEADGLPPCTADQHFFDWEEKRASSPSEFLPTKERSGSILSHSGANFQATALSFEKLVKQKKEKEKEKKGEEKKKEKSSKAPKKREMSKVKSSDSGSLTRDSSKSSKASKSIKSARKRK